MVVDTDHAGDSCRCESEESQGHLYLIPIARVSSRPEQEVKGGTTGDCRDPGCTAQVRADLFMSNDSGPLVVSCDFKGL